MKLEIYSRNTLVYPVRYSSMARVPSLQAPRASWLDQLACLLAWLARSRSNKHPPQSRPQARLRHVAEYRVLHCLSWKASINVSVSIGSSDMADRTKKDGVYQPTVGVRARLLLTHRRCGVNIAQQPFPPNFGANPSPPPWNTGREASEINRPRENSARATR